MLWKWPKIMLRIYMCDMQQRKYEKDGSDFISFLQSFHLIIQKRLSFYRWQSNEFTHGHFHRIDFFHLIFDIGFT